MTHFQNHRTPDLVSYYNEAAAALGRPPVKRFSDRETAERRCDEMRVALKASRTPIPAAGKPKDHPIVSDFKNAMRNAKPATAAQNAASAAAISANKEPAPPAPADGKSARWAQIKSAPASKVAYRPKPGTTQEVIYRLLTRPGGVALTVFVEAMNAGLKPGRQPWTVANTWGTLRYLLVAGRGYGLEFDGVTLSLIVPKDERPATEAK